MRHKDILNNKLQKSFFYLLSKFILDSKIMSKRTIVAAIYDCCAVTVSWMFVWIVVMTVLKSQSHPFSLLIEWKSMVIYLSILLILQGLLFKYFGLYRGFWRFASLQDLRKILTVALLGGVINWIFVKTNVLPIPIRVSAFTFSFLYSVFLIGFLSSARLFVRFVKNHRYRYSEGRRVIIVGAGNAGEGLVRDLLQDDGRRYKPIAFVDDNLLKIGREIHGIRVTGATVELPALIQKLHIDLVLIAIPSASSASMRSVLEICEKSHVPCYTLPGLKDLTNGKVNISVLRHISLEDLLGRYPVMYQLTSIQQYLQNKRILITGGGGSIGSELCRQIAALECVTQLVIVDNNEYNLYSIDLELRQRFPLCKIDPILLNITDAIGMKSVFEKYSPNIVFHAAAYKHVPMLENQLRTAIYNNIIGTQNVAELAVEKNVEKFVLISSDKAVNPTNIMGATKRAAEYFCQNLNEYAQKTRFITVRFGNVLDSVGSVVPLFRKQIEEGGPVTVTHPEITRFFMTIPEASQLILQAALLGEGGEIFVLDMGDPIKIKYLAEQMIKLADKVVDQDIKIVYTGLRPGEKLYEECFYQNETLQPTSHSKILRAQSQRRNFIEVQSICNQMKISCQSLKNDELLRSLKKLVPEYQATKVTHHKHIDNAVLQKTQEISGDLI